MADPLFPDDPDIPVSIRINQVTNAWEYRLAEGPWLVLPMRLPSTFDMAIPEPDDPPAVSYPGEVRLYFDHNIDRMKISFEGRPYMIMTPYAAAYAARTLSEPGLGLYQWTDLTVSEAGDIGVNWIVEPTFELINSDRQIRFLHTGVYTMAGTFSALSTNSGPSSAVTVVLNRNSSPHTRVHLPLPKNSIPIMAYNSVVAAAAGDVFDLELTVGDARIGHATELLTYMFIMRIA